MRVEDLQRDLGVGAQAALRLHHARQIDGAHAAFTEFLDHPVIADLAVLEGGRHGSCAHPRSLRVGKGGIIVRPLRAPSAPFVSRMVSRASRREGRDAAGAHIARWPMTPGIPMPGVRPRGPP
jgi:hypothetical protein